MISTHNVTWTIEPGGGDDGRILGKITCTAAKGSDCRLTCPAGCEEFAFEGHEHPLVDAGKCGYLMWLEEVYADPIEVHYAGERMPLREGPVKLTYEEESVVWEYLFLDDPTLPTLEGPTS